MAFTERTLIITIPRDYLHLTSVTDQFVVIRGTFDTLTTLCIFY